MSAHSRGPWFGGFDDGDKHVRICCAEHGVIARVRVDDIDRDEAMANAHLIESAPEMLDALLNFPRRENYWYAKDYAEACEDWWDDFAAQAIARAEGR